LGMDEHTKSANRICHDVFVWLGNSLIFVHWTTGGALLVETI